MIQQTLIFFVALIFSAMAFSCTAEEEFKTYCKAVCEQDGDKKFWIDKDGCNCGNPRPIDKIPLKIPKNMTGHAFIDSKDD